MKKINEQKSHNYETNNIYNISISQAIKLEFNDRRQVTVGNFTNAFKIIMLIDCCIIRLTIVILILK